MMHLKENDLLTRVSRYNLIRDGRMLYIDVHETLHGQLAAPFVAVPNLINIIARQEFQGTGATETQALESCLERIATVPFDQIFPERPGASSPPSTGED
jgi:hypothetical protein